MENEKYSIHTTGCFLQNPFSLQIFSRGVKEIHGYSWKGREVLDNTKVESKESFDVTSWGSDCKFPDDTEEVPEFRLKVKCLAHQSIILARRLIRSLATDLGTDPTQFLNDHSGMFTGRGNATSIRLLHYPNIEKELADTDGAAAATSSAMSENVVTRCGEHTDYGGLTLLYQVLHGCTEE